MRQFWKVLSTVTITWWLWGTGCNCLWRGLRVSSPLEILTPTPSPSLCSPLSSPVPSPSLSCLLSSFTSKSFPSLVYSLSLRTKWKQYTGTHFSVHIFSVYDFVFFLSTKSHNGNVLLSGSTILSTLSIFWFHLQWLNWVYKEFPQFPLI